MVIPFLYVCIVLKSYKYRLYPTEGQRELLDKHIGASRFVYNLALEAKIIAYNGNKVNLSAFDLMRQLPGLKEELSWLKDINAQSLQSSIKSLDRAYKNFYRGLSKYPKFKSKHNSKKTFRVLQGVRVDFSSEMVYMPKFKEGINIVVDREFKGDIKAGTIKRTSTNKYFISILVETYEECIPKQQPDINNAVGIDLGIKSFVVTSEGEVIDNPKYYANDLERLKVLQRRASRKQKGSKNRQKANLKVAKQHEKIANKRSDFLHKATSKMIAENQGGTICLEDLNVSGMLKNRKLSRVIADAGWGIFNDMLAYKAEWYGVNIIKIDRFAPSSKMCECGYINYSLKLSDRQWTCDSCGRINDRDLLAAQNIKRFAFGAGQGVSGGPVEMSSVEESMKQEDILMPKRA
jgi:putative transposase